MTAGAGDTTTPATVCYRCGTEYTNRILDRCRCGEPLWFDVGASMFDWDDCREEQGIWRYAELLPIGRLGGLAPGSGDTPLLRSPALDSIAGGRVYVKDESENPTGSYKDRGSAVAVPHAIETGVPAVGTVSHGNMAMSTAAHAASVGHDCVVLVPSGTQPVRLELIAQYGATILQVEGEYGKLYYDALGMNSELPVAFLLSDAPTRISGYKTALFEIYEQLEPETPDVIALPASSGGFASGVWRGILDLADAGLIEEFPRLVLIQAAESDPITRAFEADRTEVSTLGPEDVGETIAHSIGNPDPPSGTRALAAVRDTGGEVVSVSDDAIRAAQRQFATLAGFCVEPAAATPLAGVERLSERGVIADDETVVLIPTGTGFKEMGTEGTSVQPETVDREQVPRRLRALLG